MLLLCEDTFFSYSSFVFVWWPFGVDLLQKKTIHEWTRNRNQNVEGATIKQEKNFEHALPFRSIEIVVAATETD